jgi:hypothetical protein
MPSFCPRITVHHFAPLACCVCVCVCVYVFGQLATMTYEFEIATVSCRNAYSFLKVLSKKLRLVKQNTGAISSFLISDFRLALGTKFTATNNSFNWPVLTLILLRRPATSSWNIQVERVPWKSKKFTILGYYTVSGGYFLQTSGTTNQSHLQAHPIP